MTAKDSKNSDLSLEAQVKEEFALRQALKRIRLEKAAESPSVSWWGWGAYAILGCVLLYFQDHIVDYIWLIALVLFIEIKSSSAAVHSRIDAIMELERLRADNEGLKKDQSEQGCAE